MAFLDEIGLEELWSQIVARLNNYVPITRKINNKELNNDITLSASDVGAANASDLSSHTSNTSNPHNVTASQIGAAELDWTNRVKPGQISALRHDITDSITLSLDYVGHFILSLASSAITITVPSDSDVAWPDYCEIEICQWNAGEVTIQGATGVGIVSLDNAKTIAGQYGCAVLKKIGGSTWLLAGALK